jgi:hypothetical protein
VTAREDQGEVSDGSDDSKDKRADAIRWIQTQMADYGLTLEDLDAAGYFAPPPLPRRWIALATQKGLQRQTCQ